MQLALGFWTTLMVQCSCVLSSAEIEMDCAGLDAREEAQMCTLDARMCQYILRFADNDVIGKSALLAYPSNQIVSKPLSPENSTSSLCRLVHVTSFCLPAGAYMQPGGQRERWQLAPHTPVCHSYSHRSISNGC